MTHRPAVAINRGGRNPSFRDYEKEQQRGGDGDKDVLSLKYIQTKNLECEIFVLHNMCAEMQPELYTTLKAQIDEYGYVLRNKSNVKADMTPWFMTHKDGFREIATAAEEYANLCYPDLRGHAMVMDMWGARYVTSEHTVLHQHQPAFCSFVYYPKISPGLGNTIYFPDIVPLEEEHQQNKSNGITLSFDSGDMLMWKSDMRHEVPSHTLSSIPENEFRYVIAGNIYRRFYNHITDEERARIFDEFNDESMKNDVNDVVVGDEIDPRLTPIVVDEPLILQRRQRKKHYDFFIENLHDHISKGDDIKQFKDWDCFGEKGAFQYVVAMDISRRRTLINSSYTEQPTVDEGLIESALKVFDKKDLRDPVPHETYTYDCNDVECTDSNIIFATHNFSCIPDIDLTKYDHIIEIGGGYGALANAILNTDAFTGKYTVFDFEDMRGIYECYVQQQHHSKFNFITDPKEIRSNDNESVLLISTWALSEMPFDLRNRILAQIKSQTTHSFDYYLAMTDILDPSDDPPVHNEEQTISDKYKSNLFYFAEELDWGRTEGYRESITFKDDGSSYFLYGIYPPPT